MSNAIVIVAAKRTAMGNFGGVFKNTSTVELGAAAISAAIAEAKLDKNLIDEVLMGCVLPAGLGQAPARQAAIKAGIPLAAGATTINKMCGSGMKAVMFAADEITAGSFNTIIAGGMENMSQAPYLVPKARFGYRLGHATLIDHMMMDGLEDAYEPGKAMGCFAELCASKYHFSRQMLDDFAISSLDRAKTANIVGTFKDEITAISVREKSETVVIEQDENALKANPAKIPQLKPAFQKDGVITAANSSSISDGAAALILTTEKNAKAHNMPVLARFVAHATHSQEPEWFTTAPIGAIKKVCEKAQWKISDVDLFEINEAFAVVTLAAMKDLNLPLEKVNIHGGACALGHPIGASGARVLVTLLHALRQKKLKRGVASLCIGGGEATAVAIEVD